MSFNFTVWAFKKGYHLPEWKTISIVAKDEPTALNRMQNIIKLCFKGYENVSFELQK